MGTVLCGSLGGGTGSGFTSRITEVIIFNFRKLQILILVDTYIILQFFLVVMEKIPYSILIHY